MNKAARSYTIRFVSAMLAYSFVLVGSIFWLKAGGSARPWTYIVAVLPIGPLAFALTAFLNFFRQMDELQRRIQLDAFAFSMAATVMITFTYGLLENAGLPFLSWVYVGPMAIVLWGVGLAFATRRYE